MFQRLFGSKKTNAHAAGGSVFEVRPEVAKLFRDVHAEDLIVHDRGDGSAEYHITEEKRRAISVPEEEFPEIPAVAHLYDASKAPPRAQRDDGAALAVVIVYLSEYVKDIPLPAGTKVTW